MSFLALDFMYSKLTSLHSMSVNTESSIKLVLFSDGGTTSESEKTVVFSRHQLWVILHKFVCLLLNKSLESSKSTEQEPLVSTALISSGCQQQPLIQRFLISTSLISHQRKLNCCLIITTLLQLNIWYTFNVLSKHCIV